MTKAKKFKARVRSRMEETGKRYTEAMVEESRPVSVGDVAKRLVEARSLGMSSKGAWAIVTIVREFCYEHRGVGEAPRSCSVLEAWVLDLLWPGKGFGELGLEGMWPGVFESDEVVLGKVEDLLRAWLDGEIPGMLSGPSSALEGAARTHRDSLCHRAHVALANYLSPDGLPESEPGDDAYFEDPEGEEIFLETEEVLEGLWEREPDVRPWFGLGGELAVIGPRERELHAKEMMDEIHGLRERLEAVLGKLNASGQEAPEFAEEKMRANLAVWKPMTPVELELENQRLRALLKEQGINPYPEG